MVKIPEDCTNANSNTEFVFQWSVLTDLSLLGNIGTVISNSYKAYIVFIVMYKV